MTTQTIVVEAAPSEGFTPGTTVKQNLLQIITLDPTDISPPGPGITLDVTNTIIQLAAGGSWFGTLEVTAGASVIMNPIPPTSGSFAWGVKLGAYDQVSSSFLSEANSGSQTLDFSNFVDQGGGVFAQVMFDTTYTLNGTGAFNFSLAYQISSAGITCSLLAPSTDLVSASDSMGFTLNLTWSDEAVLPPGGLIMVNTVLPLGRKVRLDCERKINLGL